MARYMTWNIEWFTRLFDATGQPLNDAQQDTDRPPQTRAQRLQAIADVLAHVDPAFVGIIEGPDSTNANPTRSVDSVLAFAQQFGLPYDNATLGYRSRGQQEIVALWDSSRVQAQLDQGGGPGHSPRFDSEYTVDTDDDSISEVYTFYRPPLEVSVTDTASGTTASVIVCHNKSKGIFNATDLVHWEKENRRSRRMLFGQAQWIRERVDERIRQNRNVMVMGDFNDGVGMDWYEMQLGSSSVERIMGDIFEPDELLRHLPGRPRWNRSKGAWEPASTSFRDKMTESQVRILIDFIFLSRGLQPDPAVNEPYVVWNPFQSQAVNQAIGGALRGASDHFPVTVDLA